MVRLIVGRIVGGLFVLWAIFTIVFIILRVLPGDPVSLAAHADGGSASPSAATVTALRSQYGLDKPLWHQYLTAITDFLSGKWGTSVVTGQPVTTTLAEALPSTLALAISALVFGSLVACVLAFYATFHPHRLIARILGRLPVAMVSVPTFAIGLVAIQVVAFWLRLTPAFGDQDPSAIILPTITLAVPIAGYLAQVMAAGMRGAASQPFVDVARAKGASDFAVHLRHVAPAAVIPALSALGVLVGAALAGAVVVETVFSRAGLGRLTQQAVAAHDGPVLLAIVVLSAAIFVIANLIVDLVGPLIDPRTRSVLV